MGTWTACMQDKAGTIRTATSTQAVNLSAASFGNPIRAADCFHPGRNGADASLLELEITKAW